MNICWTCGSEENTPNELRAHMLEVHEEGLDFIVCPLCSVLLIDMVSHFMVHHRGAEIPDGTQIIATKPPTHFKKLRQKELKKERKRQFRHGFFDSPKNGKQLHYRSGWERDVYRILEKAFSVKKYAGEPLAIPYSYQGKVHNYWPDILITFIDGSQLLVEIKPEKHCPGEEGVRPGVRGMAKEEQAKNDAKWQAAQTYCESRGVPFVVWTENAIKRFARMRPDSLTKAVFMNIQPDPAPKEDEEIILVEDKK